MPYFYELVTVMATVWAEQFNYEGFKVFRLHVANENQLQAIANFSKYRLVDFWSYLRFDRNPIDVMVKPETQNAFVWFLNINNIRHKILIDDVEEVVQKERIEQQRAPRLPKGQISFTRYNRHDEINTYLNHLAKDYIDIVSLESAGRSYTSRDLKVIKISIDPSANNPVIFVVAGISAREWISPAQACYIINQLVEVPRNRNLLEKVDWYVLPVVNPDGYEYSHTNERFWKKTRSQGTECAGTDLNRNFGFHWGETGVCTNECSDMYMGSSSFSEPESRAVKNFIWKYKDNIKLHLTLYGCGEHLLFPWGYTFALPSDYNELQALGEMVALTFRKVRGTIYTVGTLSNVLQPVAGGSNDWVKGVAGVNLSYTIGLTGSGSWGFDPPPSQILNFVFETWEGLKAYHQYIRAKFGK